MAKSRIAGITIEIGGDTTGLQNALKGTNDNIKKTQDELKDVTRLLKLDPTNTELLKQKQVLLNKAIDETKQKLQMLQNAQRQAASEVGQNGKITQEQYRALQREVEATKEEIKKLQKEANSANAALQKVSDVTGKIGKTATKIGKGMSVVSAGIGGVATAAVKTTADFESAMSNVQAISGATGEDMNSLKEKAREMGAQTKFSATEAGEAMSYMAMAGWKTEEMMSGISGIMNLAAASGEDLATTSDIVTDALTAFGLTAQDTEKFVDTLAATATNSNTNVSLLGESFKYCAPVCGALGYSAEDTSIALGLMANCGIKATNAGTALRAILTNMAKPTDAVEALPILHIDEPTLQMTFLVNNSPFAGREGKWVTSRKVEERLQAELQTDVSLRVDPTDSPDKWTVSGRGELHLSILIETMRREGYELQVSRPEVIIKEIDGVKCEPFERVQIDTPEEYQGSIIQALSERKGDMLDMQMVGNGQTRLIFLVPARGLIGFSTEFLSMTRGYGIMNHTFDQYLPVVAGEIGGRHRGALVSIDTGKATTYSIMRIEERGTIFVNPGTEVYEGMIVGENARENDLGVNITTAKQMTNVRSATKDQTAVIKTPRILTLEESLEFLDDDEYMEVTPESIRLRKQILNKAERDKANKRKKKAAEAE